MLCAFNVILESDRLKETVKEAQREIGRVFLPKEKHKVTSGNLWRERGRRDNATAPRGGLDDSAVEACIIRATLWVSAIIRWAHILNIQWDILGRRVREQAKGQLRRSTCHVPSEICKRVCVCVLGEPLWMCVSVSAFGNLHAVIRQACFFFSRLLRGLCSQNWWGEFHFGSQGHEFTRRGCEDCKVSNKTFNYTRNWLYWGLM